MLQSDVVVNVIVRQSMVHNLDLEIFHFSSHNVTLVYHVITNSSVYDEKSRQHYKNMNRRYILLLFPFSFTSFILAKGLWFHLSLAG